MKFFIVLFLLGVPVFWTVFPAMAINSQSMGLLDNLYEKGRKANREELVAMLLPIAGNEAISHREKMRNMSTITHLSGWHLSKSEKRSLFDDVFRSLDVLRKENYIRTHQDLAPEILDAIRNSMVLIGMTKEDVTASLGKPEEIRPPMGTFLNTEKWVYYNQRKVLYFKDMRLVSLKKK
ncbi:MAG: hypothetical protein ACE5FY_01565 [Nitrospiria bacterium]